jgi:pimeloyl-ACP methyl ester carboxylesterase
MSSLVKIIWRLLLFVHSQWAGRLALYIFTRPIQSQRKKPIHWPGFASHFIDIQQERIHYLKSEGRSDRFVALFHGWMGKIEQFKKLTETLTAAGFGVLLVDMPAHGQSSGVRSDARRFAGCIDHFNRSQNLSGIVCHSLSGLATAISIHELGAHFNKVVFISAPSSGPEILNDFVRRIKGPSNLKKPLKKALFDQYGIDFDTFHGADFIKENPAAIEHFLNFHDTMDQAVPLEDGLAYAKAMDTKCTITEQLGHNRILKDDTVIHAVTDFLLH